MRATFPLLALVAILLAPTALSTHVVERSLDEAERAAGMGCGGRTTTEEIYCNSRHLALFMVSASQAVSMDIIRILYQAVVADAEATHAYAGAAGGSAGEGDAATVASLSVAWADGRCAAWIGASRCHGDSLGD